MFRKKILELKRSIDQLNDDILIKNIENISELIHQRLSDNSGILYTIGNGGSAADAQHFVAELIIRFEKNRKSLPAIALTTDTSIITAAGNDLGFNKIFSRQLEGLLKKNDILFSFSTSGESKNVINAIEIAKEIGSTTISLTGETRSTIGDISDYSILCPSKKTDNIQTLHQVIYHYICEFIDFKLTK